MFTVDLLHILYVYEANYSCTHLFNWQQLVENANGSWWIARPVYLFCIHSDTVPIISDFVPYQLSQQRYRQSNSFTNSGCKNIKLLFATAFTPLATTPWLLFMKWAHFFTAKRGQKDQISRCGKRLRTRKSVKKHQAEWKSRPDGQNLHLTNTLWQEKI